MPGVQRFSDLSPEWKAFVRILQAVNFGEIRDVRVRNGDPLSDHASVALLDAKLDSEEAPRQELNLPDFELRTKAVRLTSRLDELNSGTIRRLEVRRAGSFLNRNCWMRFVHQAPGDRHRFRACEYQNELAGQ
jgi:hypothetical protein